MKVQTLAELKAENEGKPLEKLDASQAENLEDDLQTEDETLTDDETGEVSTNENAKALEAWQLEDDSTGELKAGSVLPVATHVKMKAKLKGRLAEKDTELENLKAEIEALKAGKQQLPTMPNEIKPKPKLEDFGFDEERHNAAIEKWDDERLTAKLAKLQQVNQQQSHIRNQQTELESSVDKHYLRAAELAEKSGIAPELYSAADRNFRLQIEGVFPGKGDLIADQLIANLGEGSEKLTYFIGRNKAAQSELTSLLNADKSGVKAAIWLGRKLSEIGSPVKKTSQAPEPSPQLKGDVNVADDFSIRKMKEAYAKARKADNAQAAYDTKKKAKAAGVDTSTW